MKNTKLLLLRRYSHFVILAMLILTNHVFLSYKLPNSNKITAENSDLPSNHVNMIYIDSLDTKWIATDKGLARFDENNWVVYADSGYFKSNVINDIDYELTDYSKELWVATDSGLTVSSYGVDGITGATTYYPGDAIGSTIMDWKVSHVMVDLMHNRWSTTASAISVFKGSTWDKMTSAADAAGDGFNIADVTISDVAAYNFKEQAMFATKEKGIIRNYYNEVDGISGASTYGQPWAAVDTDHFSAIDIKGEAQWYGTNIGSYYHPLHETKSEWYLFDEADGLINNTVDAIHVDANANVWMGTANGLSIYTANETWYNYTESDGLVNNKINHITSDMQGNVWVSTDGGIEWFPRIPSGISSFQNQTDLMTLYPNPSNGIVNIALDLAGSQQILVELLSVNGQIVLSQQYKSEEGNTILVDLSKQKELISGIYFVKVTSNAKTFAQKLVINNN